MSVKFDPTMLDTLYQTGDLPILGHIAFWRVADLEATAADLAAALTAHGFGEHAPRVPTYRHALRAAIEEWLDAQGGRATQKTGAKRARRERITAVNDEASETMAFLVVTEDLDLARLGMATSTRLRFILWKEGPNAGAFTATTDALGNVNDAIANERAIAAEVAPLYAKHRGLHDAGEIARLIGQIVAGCQAVALRQNGGVYFVPSTHREAIDRLRRLCADLARLGGQGADLFLAATPVFNLGEMRAQYANLALTALEGEAKRMAAYLHANFLDKPEGTVGGKAIARQLSAFRQFREKADAYADLLDLRADGLRAEVAELARLARLVVLRDSLPDDDDDTPTIVGAEAA